jgi:hypothetical protein
MFGFKRRKREKLARAEALQQEKIAEQRRQLRGEAISIARHDLHNILSGFASQAIRMVTLWHERVVTTLQEKVRALISTRIEEVESISQAKFAEIVEQSKARLPQALINERAKVFRQNVIGRIKQEGAELFEAGLKERTEDLLSAVSAQLSSVRGVGNEALPNGTRFFFTGTDGRRAYIIEQPPMVRTIMFGTKRHKDSYKRYRLAFPFVIFLIVCAPDGTPAQLGVYFRNEPLQESTDELYLPALSNVGGSGIVCFGYREDQVEGMIFSQKVEFMLETFWGGGFNSDANACLVSAQLANPKIKTFDQWVRESKKDPRFILSLSWGRTHFRTVGSLVNLMLSSNVVDEQALKRQIVKTSIHDFAQRAGMTLAESASTLVLAWKLEDVPSEVLVSQLETLAQEGHRHIHDTVSSHIIRVVGAVKNNEELLVGSGQLQEELQNAATLRLQQAGFIISPNGTREAVS